jgi:predicted RNA-binding protein with PUA-like domain
MKYWLAKSEPGAYSIDDLARDKKTAWEGVRNYQARNYMRDEMKLGDLVLFYHSSADPTGVAGIAKVVKQGYPDASAWRKGDDHFDEKSTPDKPTWFNVDLGFVERFPGVVTLQTLKSTAGLEDKMVTKRGARFSVQPVRESEFKIVRELAKQAPADAPAPKKPAKKKAATGKKRKR